MKKKYFILLILISVIALSFIWKSSPNVLAIQPSDFGLKEGDLISAIFSDDPDVYIINEHGYKRLFLNPEIFKFYAHLGGFANVKLVTPEIRDSFPTSGFFRNCEDNDQRVFGTSVEGEDNGRLHWINKSGEQAVQEDADFFKKVFCINRKEFNWYPRGTEFRALKEVPQYHRSTEVENPVICHHPTDDPKNLQTLRVAPESLDAHFQHGDIKGACPTYVLPTLTPQPIPSIPTETPKLSPLNLKIISPNGGEQWSIGNKYIVTWEHPESIPGVKIELYHGGSYLSGLGGIGAGLYNLLEPLSSWTWDTIDTPNFTPGSDFKMRVVSDYTFRDGSTTGPTTYDESDSYFKVSGSNYPVTCDGLKSNSAYTKYYNSCSSGGYGYICFNKYYGTYQGCSKEANVGCTESNTNASQNMSCSVSGASVSTPTLMPTPTSTSTPKPTSSATPIPVQDIAYNVDLAIVDIIPSPSTPEAGKDFTVDVVIKNLGPKALSLPTITLTINNPSGQKIYDPATSYSDESNNNVISPGSTVNVKFYSDMFSPRLPETTLNFPAGTYKMIASVNNLGYVEGVFYKKDFNSSNDTFTKTLEIKSISVPTPTPTSTIIPVVTLLPAPSSVTIGWYKGFGGQPPVGTYQLAISFLYPSNISDVQSFRLYLKKPGESSFSAVATFANPSSLSSACSGDIYSGVWKMRNCTSSGGGYWQIFGPLGSSSSHPIGEYNAYLVAVDNSGAIGAASAIPKNIVSKTTILSPVGTQSSLTPQFHWSIPSSWPGGSFWPQVNDNTTYIWSKAVYSGTGTAEGSTTYDGPALNTSKTYYVNIWAEGNDSSGTRYFSMGESNPSFTVTTSPTPTPTPTPTPIQVVNCYVKIDGVVVKSVYATDRNNCYSQTSFGSANCSYYTSYFTAGTHFLEQYFGATDRVNNEYCTCQGGVCTQGATSSLLESRRPSNFVAITRNLTVGSTGNDVKQLQALLMNEVGYSADLITGYFGRITRDAVIKLQEKYGIKPTYGYFGEITRRTLSALISN